MRPPKNKVIRVQHNGMEVPIYEAPVAGHHYFMVKPAAGLGIPPRRFKTTAEAKEWATHVIDKVTQGKTVEASLVGEHAQIMARILHLMHENRIKTRPDVFIETAISCMNKLNGVPLQEAVDFYVANHGGEIVQPLPCSKVLSLLLTHQRQSNASDRHVRDLESRLTLFCEAFTGSTADLTPPAINKWLQGLQCAPRTRLNYARAVSGFLSYAKANGYLSRMFQWSIPKIQLDEAEPFPLEPDEMEAMLQVAGDFKAYLVLAGFCGVRQAEIQRMTWPMIKSDHIKLPPKVTKTRAGRMIGLNPAVASFLSRCDHTKPIVRYKNVTNKLRQIAAKANVAWQSNRLRDSWISYRVALTKNLGEVALEAGNSPDIIKSKYLSLKTKLEAEEWFGLQL